LKRGYRQYATLFLAIIADVGAAKSPALLAAQWPIKELQQTAHEIYTKDVAAWELKMDRWSAQPKADRGDKPVRPKLRHYFTSDATIEALVNILEQSPGVAIVRDEVVGVINSFDQYRNGKGSDRQQYLSLHAASPIKADRRTGEPIYIGTPVAGIVGGIQPDIAASLHRRDGRTDGMLERFLLVRPIIPLQRWTDDEIDPDVLKSVVDLFKQLDKIPLVGSEANPDGWGVQLHSNARVYWREWYDDNAQRTEQASGLLKGCYAKLPNHVARLALILNVAWNPDNPRKLISHEMMQHAINLGEFLRGHLHASMSLFGGASLRTVDGLQGRILRILRTSLCWEDDNRWVSRSTILHRLGNTKTDDLSDALSTLMSRQMAESRTKPDSTTKPTEQWRIRETEDWKYSNNHEEGSNTSDVCSSPNGARSTSMNLAIQAVTAGHPTSREIPSQVPRIQVLNGQTPANEFGWVEDFG
jgi:hypothetical protein